MRHTTNYGLSQWEADDRVTREAFNADNAAIDAALKSASNTASSAYSTASAAQIAAKTFSKLTSMTTTAAQTQIDFDLSSVDWSTTAALKIYLNTRCGGFKVLLNGETSGYTCMPNANFSARTGDRFLDATSLSGARTSCSELTLYAPARNSAWPQQCVAGQLTYCATGALQISHGSLELQQSVTSPLQTLNFVAAGSDGFLAGTSLEVYAIKR